MPSNGSNRTLIGTLVVALGGALLVIAFLLGRETNRSAPAGPTSDEQTLVPDVAPREEVRERPSPWPDEPRKGPSQYRYIEDQPPQAPRLEKRPDGTIVISNPRVDTRPERPSYEYRPSEPEMAADDSGDAVNAYFQRVDLVHSAAGAGDPNSFAMGMIKAGLGGSTAGFDRLAADSKRMEQELKSIPPPPECERYHQASLESLVEGRELLERMKTAIVSRDIAELKEISQDAAELQAKADELAEMQKQIRASVR